MHNFFTDKNFNLRSPSVNVVVPSVRKHLTTPSKGTPQNRRLNSGKINFSIFFLKHRIVYEWVCVGMLIK